MTPQEWKRLYKIYSNNLLTLLNTANGSHVEREGNSSTTVYHLPTGDLLDAADLVKKSMKLADRADLKL